MTDHELYAYRTQMGFVGRLCDRCADLGLGWGGTGLYVNSDAHDAAVTDRDRKAALASIIPEGGYQDEDF